MKVRTFKEEDYNKFITENTKYMNDNNIDSSGQYVDLAPSVYEVEIDEKKLNGDEALRLENASNPFEVMQVLKDIVSKHNDISIDYNKDNIVKSISKRMHSLDEIWDDIKAEDELIVSAMYDIDSYAYKADEHIDIQAKDAQQRLGLRNRYEEEYDKLEERLKNKLIVLKHKKTLISNGMKARENVNAGEFESKDTFFEKDEELDQAITKIEKLEQETEERINKIEESKKLRKQIESLEGLPERSPDESFDKYVKRAVEAKIKEAIQKKIDELQGQNNPQVQSIIEQLKSLKERKKSVAHDVPDGNGGQYHTVDKMDIPLEAWIDEVSKWKIISPEMKNPKTTSDYQKLLLELTNPRRRQNSNQDRTAQRGSDSTAPVGPQTGSSSYTYGMQSPNVKIYRRKSVYEGPDQDGNWKTITQHRIWPFRKPEKQFRKMLKKVDRLCGTTLTNDYDNGNLNKSKIKNISVYGLTRWSRMFKDDKLNDIDVIPAGYAKIFVDNLGNGILSGIDEVLSLEEGNNRQQPAQQRPIVQNLQQPAQQYQQQPVQQDQQRGTQDDGRQPGE